MAHRIKTTWMNVPPAVTIVAVTKTFPFDAIVMAHATGLTHIGENRAEEARDKIEEAKRHGLGDIVWHMVGHVQGRKTREVAELFDWVDSVDNLEIARKLSRAAGQIGKNMHVLIEVNLSGEEHKYGFDLVGWRTDTDKFHRFLSDVQTALCLPHLTISGLMTMAPLVTNPEKNRLVFRSMGELSHMIRATFPQFGRELSMGTSYDYEVAIEEGATQVRIGEAIFGPRQ